MKKREIVKQLSLSARRAEYLSRASVTNKELLKLYETLKFQDHLSKKQIVQYLAKKSGKSCQEIANLVLNSEQ